MRGSINKGVRGRSSIAAWVDTLGRLLFPPRCLLCDSILLPGLEQPLCSRCWTLYNPGGLICPQCEQFSREVRSCLCPSPTEPLQGLFVLSFYEAEWRRMLHRLKYSGKRHLARPLGDWLGLEILRQAGWSPEAVVPVPLHRRREAARGYNQALLIARYTARTLAVPLLTPLNKIRSIPSQTGLTRRERSENVRGVFSFNRRLPDLHTVLLVDDIYSTGATLREAAAVLRSHGLKVYGAVAAYNRRLFV